MGRKVNPISYRIGVNKKWLANWYTTKNFGDNLVKDFQIRKFLDVKLHFTGVDRIEIERSRGLTDITIHTSRPGIVIGHKGEGITKLQKELAKLTKDKIKVDIKEIKKPEIHAQLMAEQIAYQLERRAHFRRAMKQVLDDITRNSEVLGVKIRIKGRLGGSEIARSETVNYGSLPLQTLRADIDYGFALARTKFGSIGVKVWINKGEIEQPKETDKEETV